jgi:hypothetical protein
MALKRGVDQGKSAFVRDQLGRNSKADETTINEAWKAAGKDGTISGSLVYKIRSDLGLTGKGRGRRGPAAKARPGRPPKVAAASPANGRGASSRPALGLGSGYVGHRGRVLEQVEGEIDELIFRLKGLGGLAEVEEALRRARRLLYHGQPH